MKTAAKAALGVLTLAFAPSTYGIYHVWDVNNPKGSAWLKENGYSFSPPKFTNSNKLRHGCSENLFSNSKEQTNPKGNQKVYGCAVMNIELQSATAPFRDNTGKTRDPKYIKFNSEIAIRKGDEGWIISSRVGNGWQRYFDYALATYKYTGKEWKKQGGEKLWKDTGMLTWGTKSYQLKTREKAVRHLGVHNQKLVIKTPKESWWESEDWIYNNINTREGNKFPIETKRWSGAWIDDPNTSESWIFENVELYIKEKQYSQVFCKQTDKQNCFVMNPYENQGKTKLKDYGSFGIQEWPDMSFMTGAMGSETVESMLNSTVKPMINKIKSSRGIWMDIKDVCDTKETRNLNDEEKARLSMYCTNKKTN